MQIHGSMEGLEITREQKQERKEATKAKKYENKIKRMQKEVRHSLFHAFLPSLLDHFIIHCFSCAPLLTCL